MGGGGASTYCVRVQVKATDAFAQDDASSADLLLEDGADWLDSDVEPAFC